jgi:hypothetical protein
MWRLDDFQAGSWAKSNHDFALWASGYFGRNVAILPDLSVATLQILFWSSNCSSPTAFGPYLQAVFGVGGYRKSATKLGAFVLNHRSKNAVA